VTGQRITISSDSPFEARVGYARAVRTGPLVVVAGTTAPGPGVAAQARAIFGKIEAALGAAGANLADVVRTRMFVTDIAAWEELADVHAEVFGDIRPVATMVEVSALIAPDLVVEIEVDAYVQRG
jgi:enamine deaminase RidA (YjgF/YER057c/UK114 family)